MARKLPPLNPLRAFEAAARLGSIGRAARELNVTDGAISHQVRSLERALEVRLFDRQGRQLALTGAGRQILPTLGQAFDMVAEAAARIASPDLAGALALNLPLALAQNWLLPRLARFRELYPQIDLHLRPFRPGQGDAIDEAADLTIDYGSGHWDHRWVRLLMRVDHFAICSPQALRRLVGSEATSELLHPALLGQATLLHDDDGTAWDNWLLAHEVERSARATDLHLGTALLSVEAAAQGLGFALGDHVIAAADLAAGRVIRPFSGAVPSLSHYYLVAAPEAAQQPRLKAFADWLLAEARGRAAAGETRGRTRA